MQNLMKFLYRPKGDTYRFTGFDSLQGVPPATPASHNLLTGRKEKQVALSIIKIKTTCRWKGKSRMHQIDLLLRKLTSKLTYKALIK